MYCYVLLMDIYGYSWCFSILFYRSISILLKYLHSKWGTESPRDSQGAGVGPGSSFPTAFVPTRDTLDSLCLEFGFNYSGRRISKRTNNMTLKNTWTWHIMTNDQDFTCPWLSPCLVDRTQSFESWSWKPRWLVLRKCWESAEFAQTWSHFAHFAPMLCGHLWTGAGVRNSDGSGDHGGVQLTCTVNCIAANYRNYPYLIWSSILGNRASLL